MTPLHYAYFSHINNFFLSFSADHFEQKLLVHFLVWLCDTAINQVLDWKHTKLLKITCEFLEELNLTMPYRSCRHVNLLWKALFLWSVCSDENHGQDRISFLLLLFHSVRIKVIYKMHMYLWFYYKYSRMIKENIQ